MPPKPWKLISSQPHESFKIFSLRTDRAQSPRTNEVHNFYILESTDWVNVIPLTAKNEVVLISQYRHGIREVTLEMMSSVLNSGSSSRRSSKKRMSRGLPPVRMR